MFSIGDKVQYGPKNRINGKIISIFCGECDKCKEKKYGLCVDNNKLKCKVSWEIVEKADNCTIHKCKTYIYNLKDLSHQIEDKKYFFKKEKKVLIHNLPPTIEIPFVEFSMSNRSFKGIIIK